MAERNRRGIKAEMEESREILEAYVEENKTLVALLARGRALVQTLQQNSTDAAKPDSPLMQAGPDHDSEVAIQVWLMTQMSVLLIQSSIAIFPAHLTPGHSLPVQGFS